MDYSFEKQYSEILSNMVAACLGYVKNNAEKVFIHLSHEGGMRSYGFFFQIHGKIVMRGHVHEVLQPGDTPISRDESISNQPVAGKVLRVEDKRLVELFNEHGRELPTEIRVVYDARTRKLDAKCRYDPVFSMNPNALARDVELAWREEEAAKLGTEVIDNYHKSK